MHDRPMPSVRRRSVVALAALAALAGCGGNTVTTQPAPAAPATTLPGTSGTSPTATAQPVSSATNTPAQFSTNATGGPFTLVIAPTGGYSGTIAFPGVGPGSDCASGVTPVLTTIYANQPPSGVPAYSTQGTDFYLTLEATGGCSVALAPQITGTLTAPSGGLNAFYTTYMIASPTSGPTGTVPPYTAAPFTLSATGSSAAGTTFKETGPTQTLTVPSNTAFTIVLHEISST